MDLIKQNTQTKIFKSILIIFLGSILLAISAKVKIPFYPVPMTMQTFVVLSFGVCFGYKIGLATVGLYLVEGIIGLPVFSNSPERGVGLVYFTGPTMGYLIGFLFACFFASHIKLEDNYLIMFFSQLRHKMMPNKSNVDRYSLAFNVVPKGKFGDANSIDFLNYS